MMNQLTSYSVETIYLASVFQEHIGNAVLLAGALFDTRSSFQPPQWFEQIGLRFEANVDALRIGGRAAIERAQDAAKDDIAAAVVLALLLADSEREQPGAAEQATALLHHERPQLRQAAWWGLRLASSRHVEPHLRALVGKPEWDFACAAAFDVLAFHRLPVVARLDAPPNDEGEGIAWLLAEAGGRIPGAWNGTHLIQYARNGSALVREAALRASARCGTPELLGFCREAIALLEPAEAIDFLGVVGDSEDIPRLQRAAANPAVAEAAVNGLGRLGLSASVPSLLDLMESAELAEPAAAAFWRITGQEVPRGPLPEAPPGLSEDELDLWEPKAPVDVQGTRAWWKTNGGIFSSGKRYQVGLDVSTAPLGDVFDQLPLGIRYDVYLRERALTPGTPDWELETWTWKQKNPGA